MRKKLAILIAAFIVVLLPVSTHAQISIPNLNSVVQDFSIGSNGTANLPVNWKMSAAGQGSAAGWSSAGNLTVTSNQAGPGNLPTAGGRYNWGTSLTERAIGFMTSGSYSSPNAIMAFYQNNTGAAISGLNIAFAIERYRINTSAASVTFFYSTDGTNWQSETSGDVGSTDLPTGASAYTFSPPATINRTVTINMVIPNNGNIYLKWVFNTVGSNSQGLGLDDVSVAAIPIPSLSISDISLSEGNTNTKTFSFTVSLSSPAPAGGVTFDIATADNTATTAGNDYVLKALTGQSIPAGSHTYTLDVTVNGDFTIEPNETFFVNVTNVTGATVTDGQGQGTIVNDDALVIYYPRTTATDLSVASNWTDNASGSGGDSPIDFISPNQDFVLNNNVSSPVVNGAWAIGGGSNLELSNSAALAFNPAASFSLGAGSTANFNDKPIILRSTSAGTAFIGQINGTLNGATNVTVERYISSLNNRAYRLLSPSVNTTTSTRQNWQENGSNTPGYGTHITGSTTGANGFDATQTGQGSLFTLDPVSFAWQPATNTNATILNAKEGYLLYIRGDRTINLNTTTQPLPSNNTTLRATGTLLTGPQSFTGLYGNSEFNLVTNPYAAPINWPLVRAASENLSAYYTLWDPNVGEQGGYVTVHTTGVKSNPASNATVNIQSGQAFFTQATAGSTLSAVHILEAHKSGSNNVDVFRSGSHAEMFTSSLYYTNAAGTRINADAVTSIFDNSYSAGVDGDDATQMPNWDEDIAISRSGSLLSIEGRPLIDKRDTIPFTLARLQQRTYQWQFEATGFNHPNLQAALVDKYLTTSTPISLTTTTVISFTVTDNPASAASDRFMVVFSPVVALPVNLTSVKAYQKGQNIQVEWTAHGEVNMDKYEVEKSTTGTQFTKLGSTPAKNANTVNPYNWLDQQATAGANYYRIKGIGKGGEVQYSKIVRVNMGTVASEIVVYPNPIRDKTFALSVNLPKGTYTVRLTNAIGQELMRMQMIHQGGAATQTISSEKPLAKGIYQITITNGEEHFVQTISKQ